ncbi:vascular endothelial growth factor receptor 1-like [Copidosoma floridanum]|uniref:vascular endothelial growth factor receptor 1-like n=1 Tax=Copidosoma floridanum TaxID=29053 RepID=UPI000C6F9DD7|nr:vascular endothelial growth factor receptor 1-like [Copidosoma floridanum]
MKGIGDRLAFGEIGVGIFFHQIYLSAWLFIVILMFIFINFCLRLRQNRLKNKQEADADLEYFEKGAPNLINPDLTVHDQAALLPYDIKWEFPRKKIVLKKQLENGHFGAVMKAKAYGIRAYESVTTVSVKIIPKNADLFYTRALMSELKIMTHLGKHLNVVNLLGACTRNIYKQPILHILEELLVILEHCRFGNLQDYLLHHRNTYIDQIDLSTGKIDSSIRKISKRNEPFIHCTDKYPLDKSMKLNDASICGDSQSGNMDYKSICTQDLISWAFQVACGMEFISQRKVAHGNLAVRNILLADNNIVKICDYGFSKITYESDYCSKSNKGPAPTKWMSIEAIRDGIIATMSDVWSFGVVMWELFTLAETPYLDMNGQDMYRNLIMGYRMEKPIYANNYIYNIMLRCWQAEPTSRPSFRELVRILGKLLDDDVRIYLMKLNHINENINKLEALEGKKDYLAMMASPDIVTHIPPQSIYMNIDLSGRY